MASEGKVSREGGRRGFRTLDQAPAGVKAQPEGGEEEEKEKEEG